MHASSRPRVKICCISSVEEAHVAIRYGASALGLVSTMPSGPGVISEEQIAEIAVTIPPGVASFLLTSKQDAPTIIGQQRRTKVNTIQICDSLEMNQYPALRSALPGVALVQVIHVRGRESIEEARAVAPHVNAILLDSGNQSLAVKELGGTGRTHDWAMSREIREVVDVPVFLAGGLNAGNVTDALDKVRPYALDLCSGVRTHGKLDEAKVSTFFQRVREWTIGDGGQ